MRLCHFNDLPELGSRGFDPLQSGQDSVLLVRKNGQVFAYADICPHHSTPMAWRKDSYLNGQGDRIVCAAHGAQFDIETGLCTVGPCLGESLTPVPIIITPQGEVVLSQSPSQETE